MKRAVVLSLATIMAGMAAPAAAYYWTKPSSDPLDDTLRAYNFRRINPPSNLMTVGALYYVDAAGKNYTSFCPADQSDLDGQVIVSPTWGCTKRSSVMGGSAPELPLISAQCSRAIWTTTTSRRCTPP